MSNNQKAVKNKPSYSKNVIRVALLRFNGKVLNFGKKHKSQGQGLVS